MDILIKLCVLTLQLLNFVVNSMSDKEPYSKLSQEPDQVIEVEALGRHAEIGYLYDAINDEFLKNNVFNISRLPQKLIVKSKWNKTSKTFTNFYSYQERFDRLDISEEMRLNILCFSKSYSHFFNDIHESARSEKVSLLVSLNSYMEILSVSDGHLKPFIDRGKFENMERATHMVVGIIWGGEIFVSVETSQFLDQDHQDYGAFLNDYIQLAHSSVSTIHKTDLNQTTKEIISRFKIGIFSNILPDNLHLSFIEILKNIRQIPEYLNRSNEGKGHPLIYIMIPMSTVSRYWDMDAKRFSVMKNIHKIHVSNSVQLFDTIISIGKNFNDLYNDIHQFRQILSANRTRHFERVHHNFEDFSHKTEIDLRNAVIDMRTGKFSFDQMAELLKNKSRTCTEFNRILPSFIDIIEEITFVKSLEKLKVKFVTEFISLPNILTKYEDDIYVLKYNSSLPSDDLVVIEKFQKMVKEEEKYGKFTVFAAANYQFLKEYVNVFEIPAKITKYRDRYLICDNFDPDQK